MLVAIDGRLADRGLGVGHFVTRLTHALLETGEVEVVWLGTRAAAPAGAAVVPSVARLPYPALDLSVAQLALRRLGVDLVHFAGNTGWRRRTRLPTVLTVHDLIFMRTAGGRSLRQRLGHAYERRAVPPAVRAATRVVAVSNATADEIRAAGMRAEVEVIHHGLTARPVAAGPPATAGPYLVAFAGRDPRKATDIAVEAFKLLAGRVETLHLLASAGLPDGFSAIAGELVDAGRIVVHEHEPRAVVDSLIAGAAALVYPSRDEGFGLPVLEGLQLGTPVVTGLAPATIEVGGDAVLRIDPAAPAASVAAAVCRVIERPELRDRLRALGYERARRFSWSTAASRYLSVYRDALA